MFLLGALGLVAVALAHGYRAGLDLDERLGLVPVYRVAGYHGVVMLAVTAVLFFAPEQGARMVSSRR